MPKLAAPTKGLLALLAGATGIGFAPVFVRLTEVGPSATAFYRMLFALPLLWLWLGFENRTPPANAANTRARVTARDLRAFSVAGLLFTADLAFWHWSLQFTSVANSTLLANFAPLFVTVGAWLFFHERISLMFLAGMVTAIGGAGLLVAASVQFSSRQVLGDALAVVAALFYAGYLLAVKRLRDRFSAVTIMSWSGIVSAAGLLIVAVLSREDLWPETARGWAIVVALALVSHLCGQTLIAYAFGHLPASISSLNLLLQPVVAAAAAWLILHERLSMLQAAGAVVVLFGIAAGNWFRR